MIYKKTVGCWLCGGVNKVPGAGEVRPELGWLEHLQNITRFSKLESSFLEKTDFSTNKNFLICHFRYYETRTFCKECSQF